MSERIDVILMSPSIYARFTSECDGAEIVRENDGFLRKYYFNGILTQWAYVPDDQIRFISENHCVTTHFNPGKDAGIFSFLKMNLGISKEVFKKLHPSDG